VMTLPWRQSLAVRLRNYFLAGVLVTAPVAITLYAAWWVVNYIDEFVTSLLPDGVNPGYIPGLGIAILVVVLTLAGFLTANFLGRILVQWGERILSRLPVIRSVYSAVKQIFETVFSKQTESFREVVLVEYPRKDMWVLGLVIGRTAQEIQNKAPEELASVFIPTMSFTSGYLVFVPRKDMTTLEMTVEECLKMVISGGIVLPKEKAVRKF
jgi:uncharacterized membrane protein